MHSGKWGHHVGSHIKAFILSEMRSHWRILSRGYMIYVVGFFSIT